ncbi:MAG: glycerophosphodiester phosphodiesterase [Blastocatellia bacterium]
MNRYCFLLILLLGLIASDADRKESQFFEPVQPPRPIQVMAHRGASGQAPENTRPALERAIEDGFEWAEIDLQLTRDGQHVLDNVLEDALAARKRRPASSGMPQGR